jgi:hypothetical protein
MRHRESCSSQQAVRSTCPVVLFAAAFLVGICFQPPKLRGEMSEEKDRVIYKSVMTEQERQAREMPEMAQRNLSHRMLENISIEVPPYPKSESKPREPSPKR